MATQKPGEWANSLLMRFEEQVSGKMRVKMLPSEDSSCL